MYFLYCPIIERLQLSTEKVPLNPGSCLTSCNIPGDDYVPSGPVSPEVLRPEIGPSSRTRETDKRHGSERQIDVTTNIYKIDMTATAQNLCTGDG